MGKIAEQFNALLKHRSVEEFVDLYLFRPIAFIIVKLIGRTPITPNQISLLSITTGIISGFFLARGTPIGFFYGGLFYGVSHVLDCCDGMVARLKGNGSLIGRIIDGFADYTSATAMFIGLITGLLKADLHFIVHPWVLVIASSISTIIHAMVVDYYKSEFLAHGLDQVHSTLDDRERFSAEFERLKGKKGKYIFKFMIWLYLGYSHLQLFRNKVRIDYDQATYYRKNKLLLRLWTWIGIATHIFVLVVAAFLYKPGIFFYYTLVGANIWMVVLLIIQVRVNKKIARVKKAG